MNYTQPRRPTIGVSLAAQTPGLARLVFRQENGCLLDAVIVQIEEDEYEASIIYAGNTVFAGADHDRNRLARRLTERIVQLTAIYILPEFV